MRLSAALVPPPPVLAELEGVVASAGDGSRELDVVPAASMHVTLTKFGHVAQRDAVKLADRLRREAAEWPAMKLRFSGGTALEWQGDDSVWAKLDGDLEQLTTVARAIPPLVRPMGFLVDRRIFRTWLRVARITDFTTAPFLQRVVDALEAHEGASWTVTELCLLGSRGMSPGVPHAPAPVFDRIQLAG